MTTTPLETQPQQQDAPERDDYALAYSIVEQMGLGFEFRNCSCGQLPCARLRPIVDALAKREAEVRATADTELTVELVAKELRELWPNCSFQIREENNAGFYKPFNRHFEIGVISTDYDVHGERFEGATLDEAMHKARAWSKSRAQKEGE